jgi:hypothetical protein
MTGDESRVATMNFFCPLNGVLIRARAKVGKKAKLEVVVRVDEAREQQVSGQIDGGCRWGEIDATLWWST